ncbi:hypothetical protein CEXT_573361 [Caerostris extrusa]|uniref:Uncharacterized protein n=1 Tax=Caerostris extrusa TaxID=172846 RepID=A0AAV4XV12_CAEEX|nr:hypothetical protein CEXT_573361 [Caerostris extrusa]
MLLNHPRFRQPIRTVRAVYETEDQCLTNSTVLREPNTVKSCKILMASPCDRLSFMAKDNECRLWPRKLLQGHL